MYLFNKPYIEKKNKIKIYMKSQNNKNNRRKNMTKYIIFGLFLLVATVVIYFTQGGANDSREFEKENEKFNIK